MRGAGAYIMLCHDHENPYIPMTREDVKQGVKDALIEAAREIERNENIPESPTTLEKIAISTEKIAILLEDHFSSK